MKKTVIFLVLTALFMVTAGTETLFAQRGGARAQGPFVVRLASPLPRESAWGHTLDRIAAEWNRITGGQVRLHVLHGGTEGGEGTMQRSLSTNAIQAAVFTTFGLSHINPAIMTVGAPFLIRDEEELNVVMNEVQADLEAQFNSSNYFIVAWSRAGFVNFFSREPVLTPDDLRRQRIASNPEAAEMNATFSAMGFNIVETDWVDIGPMMATGQVSALYQNPAGIAAFQLHSHLRNMLSLNIAPVLGGIVINQVTWRRIGSLNPRFQPELMRVTRQIAAELDSAMLRTVNDAVTSMTRDGLTINRPTPAQEQLWFSEIERATPTLMANTYDQALYQRISSILARHRAGR